MKKNIEDYDNKYSIYDNGDVENNQTKKILQGSISKAGYKYYRLSKDGKKKALYAHRLVATYFVPNPNNLPIVNHKDGNKLNNNVDNLEWVSYSDNVKHAYEYELITKRKKSEYDDSSLEGEVWKEILNFDNYLVSNKGRIKNKKTNLILKPSIASGYYKVRLSKNGLNQDFMVHKLVYCTFNNEPYLKDKEFIIDHIDANKTNNNLENLRKITLSENVKAAFYEQKVNKAIKKVGQYSIEGKLINTFPSMREAARQLNLDSSTISKVCRGINKTHGGFIFKFLD